MDDPSTATDSPFYAPICSGVHGFALPIPAITRDIGDHGDSQPLPKTRAQRDNICLTGTYLVPLEPRTLLTNS